MTGPCNIIRGPAEETASSNHVSKNPREGAFKPRNGNYGCPWLCFLAAVRLNVARRPNSAQTPQLSLLQRHPQIRRRAPVAISGKEMPPELSLQLKITLLP